MKFRTVSDFYREKFGCKVYKISLSAACTCPNRDGTKGVGGCIFCSASGSGDFAADGKKSIKEQIAEAKLRVAKKMDGKNGKFIAYFQNFTNTYGNPERLENLFREAIAEKDIVGLDIATRPDCLGRNILSRIGSLSRETFVSVELGLQTSRDDTAQKINRCYKTAEYDDAVRALHAENPEIHVVTHVIFGLPGESAEDMLETVSHALHAGTDGIKFTVLHVLKNTALLKMYEKGEIRCLSKDEYFSILKRAISLISLIDEKTVVHRLTGDGDKKILVAPLWTSNKRQVLNELAHFLRD